MVVQIVVRPDQSCIPTDFQGAAAWFQNWNAQMQIIGASLGYSTGELDRIKDDNTMVQFLADAMVSVEAYRGAMTDFRRGILTKPNGSATPDYPSAFAGLVLPATGSPVTAGIWDRVNHDIDRIRALLNFTEETGSLLGINPIQTDAPDAASVKPTGKLDAALHGYLFSTVVANRQQATMWQVWIRKAGTSEWTLAATAEGKSVDITFDPGEESGPIALEVYIQLRKGNANYGQPSDIILVTVNP